MRLGLYPAQLADGLDRRRALRRHRGHRAPPPPLRGQQRATASASPTPAWCSPASSPDRHLVEFVELPRDVHPFYVGTQAHPELRSRPNDAHPLFRGLVGAALERQQASLPVRRRAESAGPASRDERRPIAMPAAAETLRRVFDGRVWDLRATRSTRRRSRSCASTSTTPVRSPCSPSTSDDRVLLIRQYRHPVRTREWEIPAGLLDVAGEDPLAAAQRELAEEADLAAAEWDVLADFFTSPGRQRRGDPHLPRPRAQRDARGVRTRGRGGATWRRAGCRSTSASTPCSPAACRTRRSSIGVLAAHASRARGWSTLAAGRCPVAGPSTPRGRRRARSRRGDDGRRVDRLPPPPHGRTRPSRNTISAYRRDLGSTPTGWRSGASTDPGQCAAGARRFVRHLGSRAQPPLAAPRRPRALGGARAAPLPRRGGHRRGRTSRASCARPSCRCGCRRPSRSRRWSR